MMSISPRRYIRRTFFNILRSRDEENVEHDLSRSAVVFAPHPDDETLGCGGTIVKKVAAGSSVHIVFMTDGGRSHVQHMEEEQLKSIRREEALEAARALGVRRENVTFLDIRDQELLNQKESAIIEITRILSGEEFEEVYIPHQREYPRDHIATNEVVQSVLHSRQQTVNVFEYPVWLWNHWPWIKIPLKVNRSSLRLLRNSIVGFLGYRMLKDLRHAVYIGDVLHQKRAALDRHTSQMESLVPGADWPTLIGVSGGEFLDCFFQDYEFFKYYRMESGSRLS